MRLKVLDLGGLSGTACRGLAVEALVNRDGVVQHRRLQLQLGLQQGRYASKKQKKNQITKHIHYTN